MTLKEWLAEKDISHGDFARTIGRSAEAVRRYMNGERIPDRETMPLIVEHTGGAVTANDFFGIVEQANPAADANQAAAA